MLSQRKLQTPGRWVEAVKINNYNQSKRYNWTRIYKEINNTINNIYNYE
jgi:hypothetical protein